MRRDSKGAFMLRQGEPKRVFYLGDAPNRTTILRPARCCKERVLVERGPLVSPA
jgi:hypothetical protein